MTVSRVATAALVAGTGNKQWVRMIPVKQRNAAHATSSHPGDGGDCGRHVNSTLEAGVAIAR